ncbi:MAG: guanylate kinase [Bacteroidales bacterium]|nr:guanylate kinase [Bacteroidales bacterium]MDY2916222.1 guanylate kinase [Muribaculaceae bacterium]
MNKKGKIIVISAPSGCGKSTIINSILGSGEIQLRFSVSATNRAPRPGEEDGVQYHFFTTEEFRDAIASDAFVEWEQVYPGRYYGTLRRELSDAATRGENTILDIDVKGALKVKQQFGDDALLIFIMPPSVEALRQRLIKRGTDSAEVIAERIGKAEYEMSFAPQFDRVIVNDDLPVAVAATESAISDFINK